MVSPAGKKRLITGASSGSGERRVDAVAGLIREEPSCV